MPENGLPLEQGSGQGKSAEISKLQPYLEARYQNEKDKIKEIYKRVWVWHGTGRYEGVPPKDILKGIVDSREISLHQDIWDGTLKTTKSISATKYRPYATVYADMHIQKDHDSDLQFKDRRNVIRYMARQTLPHVLSLIRYSPYLWTTRKPSLEWMERKVGGPLEKIPPGKALIRAVMFGTLRSTIPGDYPILVGVSHNAFKPIRTAGYIGASEVRTNEPIPIDKITHFEVPLKYVEQTQALLNEKGVSVPILPRELGERYGTEFSDKELATGKGFAAGKGQ